MRFSTSDRQGVNGAFFRIIPLGMVLGFATVLVFIIPAQFMNDGSVSTDDGTLLGFLMGTVLSFFSLRLSLVLPAAAVGEFMRVPESWEATKGQAKPIFVAALFIGLLTIVPDLLRMTPLGSFLDGFLYDVISQWFLLMLGVSILTTMYGHYVEKRELR